MFVTIGYNQQILDPAFKFVLSKVFISVFAPIHSWSTVGCTRKIELHSFFSLFHSLLLE